MGKEGGEAVKRFLYHRDGFAWFTVNRHGPSPGYWLSLGHLLRCCRDEEERVALRAMGED